MGTSKLLLDWDGRPLIDVVLQAWVDSRVDRTVVVIRPDDDALAARCRAFPVDVVVPVDSPGDMRESVEIGLQFVQQHYTPGPSAAWLVAPADLAGLSAAMINCVLSHHDPASPRIVVPRTDTSGGHPVLLPWDQGRELRQLPPHVGLNHLVRRGAPHQIDWQDLGTTHDIDTPADYRRHRPPSDR
jgi:molybdenum cofactor cytidylyltransferase